MYVFFLFSLGKNTDRPIEKTVVTIDLKCQYLHFLFQIKKKNSIARQRHLNMTT